MWSRFNHFHLKMLQIRLRRRLFLLKVKKFCQMRLFQMQKKIFFVFFFPEGFDFQPYFDSTQQSPQLRGQGSGFFISEDGYILTNAHVLQDADRFRILMSDGREFDAFLIAKDHPSDLAVLKVDGQGFPFLTLGDSDRLSVGEWVLAIGNPFGLSNSLSAGIVSAKGRSQVGISNYENFIQTDAAINPGNSGGPLLNQAAEVIGINTAIFSRSGGYMGIGFAIPSNMARNIKDQLIKSGEVRRAYFGVRIRDLTSQDLETLSLTHKQGVMIDAVVDGSPAEKAGFLSGDILLSLDDVLIKDSASFRNDIALIPPNTRVSVHFLRDRKKMTISLLLSDLKAPKGRSLGQQRDRLYEGLGVLLIPLDPTMRRLLSFQGDKGILVKDVVEGSLADLAAIRPDAILVEANKEVIFSLDDFDRIYTKAQKSGYLQLLIYQNSFMRYVTIRF